MRHIIFFLGAQNGVFWVGAKKLMLTTVYVLFRSLTIRTFPEKNVGNAPVWKPPGLASPQRSPSRSAPIRKLALTLSNLNICVKSQHGKKHAGLWFKGPGSKTCGRAIPHFLFGSEKSEVSKRGWRTERVGARKSLPHHRFRPFFCPLSPITPYE